MRPNSGYLLYLDFRAANGTTTISVPRRRNGGAVYGDGTTISAGAGRNPAADVYTSLAQFERVWYNEVIPEGVAYVNIGIALRSTYGADAYLFAAAPMLCEVGSLDAPLVPYSAGGNSASITEINTVTSRLNDKVQAMHTVKVEAISGGRKVISGLALGADGQTGDSQMLVYANKFAIVDPTSKSLSMPFVVATENGKSKVALDGDVLASGTVLGKHIAASQEIVTPVLNSPTINTTTINGGHINIGNGNFVVDWHGNMFAKSGTFDGTVRAGMLTGNVLSSYEVIRTGVGTYSVYIPPIELDAAVLVQYLVTSGSTGEVNIYDAAAILGTRRWTVTRCNHHEITQYVHSTPASWWLRKNIQPYVVMEAVTKAVTGLFRLSRGQGASVVVNVRDYHSNLIDASSIVLATVMPIK